MNKTRLLNRYTKLYAQLIHSLDIDQIDLLKKAERAEKRYREALIC